MRGKCSPLADRFWPMVRKSETCWLWTGARSTNGYGRILSTDGRMIGAHRAAWLLTFGEIPSDMEVCHHCDVRLCVRPDHLFLGTQQDNMTDAVNKQRMAAGDRHGMRTRPDRRPRGERHGMAKLTAEKVREMRALYLAGGVSQVALGAQFDVHQMTVSRIVRGLYWPDA
jgi:hypothetical protein